MRRVLQTRQVGLIIILLALACAHRQPAGKKPATLRPYQINGKWYYPKEQKEGYSERGMASWYGLEFHGRRTASGEVYNMHDLTAAHRTLPMDVYVQVTNESTKESVAVRINDRGPFVKGRIIDLSKAAAEAIGMHAHGVVPVTLQVLGYKTTNRDAPFKPPDDLDTGTFYVQVGAFKNKDNAERLQTSLRSDYEVVVAEAETPIGVVFRVRIGPYTQLEDAVQIKDELETNEFPDAFVIAE